VPAFRLLENIGSLMHTFRKWLQGLKKYLVLGLH
jgi:hypothetical protein